MPDTAVITRTQTRHNNPQICRAEENTAITQSLKEEKMSGREREVVLEGGPPWGFRITGGSDTVQDLKVERGGEKMVGGISSSSYYCCFRSVG